MLIHEPSHSLLLRVRDPFAVRELIPHSKTLDHARFNLQVEHTEETAQLLRNLGVNAPSPIATYYDWPGKHDPYEHQKAMAEFMATHFRCFNLSEMGTMKTAATLWAADYLMHEGLLQRVLILSTLSTMKSIWLQEIFDVLMHRQCVIVHGTREKRREALAMDKDFYILNHDGVSIQEVARAARRRKDIGLIVVDEGAVFRNSRVDRYRDLVNMIRPDQRVWWLTGAPCPNAPSDAWPQCRIVNPTLVPEHFGVFKRKTMMQLSAFKWEARRGSEQMVFEAMQPAIRFLKKDVIDLPPVITIPFHAQLTKEQCDAFNEMRRRMQTEAEEQQITAVNAADKLGKLRQILCGAIKDPQSDKYLIYPHGPRVEVLKEVIDNASAKVIVIVPFKGITYALEKELKRTYTVVVVNGDVPLRQRDRVFHAFKKQADPHILLCHPKVMAHGLNLTEADTMAFYAPIFSNDEYQQVIERFNRAGQTLKMTIARIGAHPLEWAIYQAVDTRAKAQDTILALYNDIIGRT